jgi:hypothetical protein
MALLIFFTVTNEFVYAVSENETTNTNFTNKIPLELIDNLTSDSNALGTLVSDWVGPIVQIQYDVGKNLLKSTNNDPINNSSKYRAGLTQQKVLSEFNKIQNIPYNEKSMNCQVKSRLFAKYLYDNGGRHINLVIIQYKTGKYSHEFVEWNGHYYDACNSNELSYTLSEKDYLQQLHQLGFTGMMITSPYPN